MGMEIRPGLEVRSGWSEYVGWSRRVFLQVAAAAGIWAVRGRSGGAAATEAKDVAWLPEVQTPPAKLPPDLPPLAPLLVDDQGRRIESLAAWQARRGELRKLWLDFLGPLPAERPPAPKLTVLSEDRTEGTIRQHVQYEAEPGQVTQAYLIRPEKVSQPAPGIVALHSTVNESIRQPAGIEGEPTKAFGLKFAQRGCVTISPRNYLWPDNNRISAQPEADRLKARRPEWKGMAKMLHDAQVALDILVAQPEVDPQRLGAVGHSLGAKEVLYLAAFDERVRATVSSEGGVGVKFSNWNADWYLGPAVQNGTFTRDHHELLALAAPRPFLLVGGDSADGDRSWPYIEAALAVYRLYGETARLGLLNHRAGHSLPTAAEPKVYDWLMTYL